MQDITPEYTEQYKKNAQQKFDNELNPFLTKLFSLGTTNLKARLTQKGLEKVLAMDKKREVNHRFDQEMSDKTWELLEEVCNATVNLLLIKLSNSYGLKVGHDWEIPNIASPENSKKDPQKS